MKSPFSRFFGSGDKAEEAEQAVEVKPANKAAEEVVKLPIAKISANKFQPRTVFDEEKIEELARTIEIHGVIQPIVVRASDQEGEYEIIAGERRFRAMSSLGWEEVPAIIRQLSDKETASIALIENLQREELTSIEEANAYQNLLEIQGITQEALAQRLGKGQSTVANKLRLLKLPEEIQTALLNRIITERHARVLLKIKDADKQKKMFDETVEQSLNVKQLEMRVEKLLSTEPKKAKPRRKAVSRDIRIAMNTIKESLSMVTKSGINLSAEEEEHEEYYQITVKIPKKKA
ncbi:chromosome partitioning protein ParB [Planococcus glaciei]|uniref:Nucleoid occlusion protein n=1 Tax=Planococcus glaciei TaxID=459472 RepID=A0A1G8MF30_9BACL|nr:nucleoid occlusion protein [Planococcus glaciei]KOF09718.1 chromosome partitioning protein ParB [Planococcus glaciei]MBX0316206.1 nucleoid occlusion protein [Planococcus glaciei]QDY45351.1 nucleoid occlusion protein [Planococcus glaciei]QKX50341.1 nucleoid occlusion protein [Planococcus glaciei]SDI66417.1 chromosome partitioning protein, ParB family [Planococcus glaciei]